jgi:hypothetical protein
MAWLKGEGGTAGEPLSDTSGRHHDGMNAYETDPYSTNSVLNYEEVKEREGSGKMEEGKGTDYEYGPLSRKKYSPHPKTLRVWAGMSMREQRQEQTVASAVMVRSCRRWEERKLGALILNDKKTQVT